MSRTLTMPRPWTLNLFGVLHEHALSWIVLICMLPLGVWMWIGFDALPGWIELALIGTSVVLVSGGARHLVMAPILRGLKRCLVGNIRVLFFRSFDPARSNEARDTLGPILGSIGQLTTVNDPAYVPGFAAIDGHDHDAELQLAWLELGEELSNALDAPRFSDADWQDGVRALVAQADLVVFDLTKPSFNIDWEITLARSCLPHDRILVLRSEHARADDHDDAIHFTLSPRGRWRLRRALTHQLRHIARA